jgi:acyl-coenzyme A synthetase/AMP-(fatty) acid ligase
LTTQLTGSRSIYTLNDRSTDPVRLATGLLTPRRVSLRKPVNVGVMAELAANKFGRSVPLYLDRPFSWDRQQRVELDYVDVAELIEQYSAALAEIGVRPWDRVAIIKTPNYDVQSLAWAAARIGAIPALLSARLDPTIVSVLLDRLQPRVIVTDAEVAGVMGIDAARAKALSSRIIGPIAGGVPIEDLSNAPVPPAAPLKDDEPMMITHTSSTTGISKLGETSARAVTFSALREAIFPGVHAPSELFASAISHVHVRGAVTQMASMSRGTPVLGIGQLDETTFLELMQRYRPTIVEAHPNAFLDWERFADHESKPFASVRVFFNTFDAIHPRTIARLLAASERRGAVWLQCYGMTEVQVVTVRPYTRRTLRTLDQPGSRSVGVEVPGVRARIADPATGRRRRRQGEPGMIQVKTPAQIISFVGTPEKFAERSHGKWFDTGDWGRRGALHQLEVLDRVADRIEGVESCLRLEDILLARLPGADEVVVVDDGTGRAVPVICMKKGESLDPAQWRAAAEGLGELGEPLEISAEDLRHTATAKPRRFLLTELIKSRQAGARQEFDPATAILREGA